MSTLTATAVRVNLERACHDSGCEALADRFKAQLGVPNYSRGASVMAMPASLDEWRAEHRTARKRADRAARLGYRFDEIDRSIHNDAIHEINVSKQERQGRPMSAGYLERHKHGALPAYPCERHRVHTYGVLYQETLETYPPRWSTIHEKLVAYSSVYVCGELLLISMILGHGDHLRDDVMYLLAAGMISAHAGRAGIAYYNSHRSGTDGLRYYKERLGFRATDIEWLL